MTDAYVRVHGLELTDDETANRIISGNGISTSGGGKKTSDFQSTVRDWSEITFDGREVTKYEIEVEGFSRADIEEFIAAIENAPDGAIVNPMDEDRINYLASATATRDDPKLMFDNGVRSLRYYATAEILCREPRLLDATAKGLSFRRNMALPATSDDLTNEGHYTAGLDHVLVSGYYDTALGYSQDVTVKMLSDSSATDDDRTIDLCSKLLRRDVFELSRWGQCVHTYETSFPMLATELVTDLHGSSYADVGTGSVAYQACELHGDAKLIVPFHGPIPISRTMPTLEFTVTGMSGNPSIVVATIGDLSDIDTLDHGWHIGKNTVRVPDVAGCDFLGIGIVTEGSQWIILKDFKAQVSRYLSYEDMPTVDPDEEFVIQLADDGNSNHMLAYAQVDYRDVY